MKKIESFSIISIIIVYLILALIIDNAFVLPKLSEIILSLKNIIFSGDFALIVFSTLFRFFIGLSISFIFAIVLAIISFHNRKFRSFMEPLYLIFKTIPNITYIIIALIWFGREATIILVSFMVVFPLLYNSFLSGFLSIDKSLIMVTDTFEDNYYIKLFRVYLPLIKPQILLALKNAISLDLKVSVMAEMLSQIKYGIGKELYFAKSNYLMANVLSWTIVIILISLVFDYILNILIEKNRY